MKSSFKKIIATLLLSFLTSYTGIARQIPTVSGILKTSAGYTSAVVTGSSSAVNVISAPVVTGTRDYNVQNTISLKYDLNTDTFFLAPTSVRVKVIIARLDVTGSTMTTISRKLNISINNKLNNPILEQSSVNLINGYQVTVTVDSIWINGVSKKTLPRYVSVESEINLDRYYDFSSTGNTVPSNSSLVASDKDCDGNVDELELNWTTPAAVPEEYQVEWYYVSNYIDTSNYYPAGQYTTDFKNNSTRITTTGTSYKISLIYPHGFIVFRVRGVGRNYNNPLEMMYGNWNLADQVNIGTLSSAYYYTINAHERKKNWQFSSIFAEEGKKKEIVSYFDGGLHNRQTVTKVNSDKNVIVGETLYDYQGRPAVNVLPVPVNFTCTTTGMEPVIRYYNKFNVDDTNKVYSKNDFDLDAGGACLPSSAPMDTASGASLYYSNNNTHTVAQQSYLPHAKEYPFTQIEYTPDNTGRVRSQSGLGKDYKLGSGKETKYTYGQPNQIQLDRLFGSEAGDASHYKKNVVIDANGQTSVTYLNQEGKVVATALAGIPPTVGSSTTTRLDSLTYAAQNQSVFTIDAFNKDANGISKLNTIPASKDQLVFSTQLQVDFRSTYDFRYTLNVPTFPDACLRSGVCMSCIYDMEIQVKDECGVDLVPTVSPYKSVKRVTGNVDTTGNKLTFNTNCTVPTLKDSAKFSLVLQPGVYTVMKTLKVNQLAKDYYVKKYTDSVYNSCIMTLKQFQASELTQAYIDTLDCYNSCSSCLAALGTRDDYVASGRGTAEQWDFLADQCNEPCRQKTACQTAYNMLLIDVSPGGQYGRFDQTTYSASNEPVSVFNVDNKLRPNQVTTQLANWRNPLLKQNGNFYNMYLDENGVRTKILLTSVSGGAYQPDVNDLSKVYFDYATNVFYTYPENLKNLSDFISVWKSTYARSLVVFHPEYAYYVSCSDHAIKYPGDPITSDDLDSLMFTCNTFGQALTAGFILPNYLTTTPAINKIVPIWSSTSGLYDPFFTNTTFQYQTSANAVTGSKTNIQMSGSLNYNINLQSNMTAIINNYNGTGYTMMDIAASLARCGNNFGTVAPPAACIAFGTDVLSPPSNPMNDSIRNMEWRIYRQLYYSEKQKQQFKRTDFYAKYGNDAYSNYYGGCNACIGVPTFNSFNSGMITLNSSGVPNPYPQSAFYDTSQPCGQSGVSDYAGKTKRYYNPSDLGLNTDIAGKQLHMITGQCPMAFQLQSFLNSMASQGKLLSPVTLSTIGEFCPDLYNAVNGGTPPPAFTSYTWHVVFSTPPFLVVDIVNAATSATNCTIRLNTSGSSISSFANVIAIEKLGYNPSGLSNGEFTTLATYVVGSTTLQSVIAGTTSCMDLKNCNIPLAIDCQPNQLAGDLQNLFSYLKANGQLGSTSLININSGTTDPLVTTPVRNTMPGASTFNYQFVSPDKLTISDFTGIKLVMTYSVSPPSAAANIKTFSNMNATSGISSYSMIGLDASSVPIATITGKVQRWTTTPAATVDIPMGMCDYPEPVTIDCSQKEHLVRKDLEVLINQILSSKIYTSSINLYNLNNFTPLLKSYKSATINATSSTYTNSTSSSPNYDSLTIAFTTTPAAMDAGCTIKLYHRRNNGTILNFSAITNVTNLTGIGSPDIAGNYYQFAALATYTTLTTDTIYGYSCFPIKNCPTKIITLNTGFNRAANAAYNGFNTGNPDPYWTIIKLVPINSSGTPIGSPIYPSPIPQATNIVLAATPIPNADYISLYPTYAPTGSSVLATYKTEFYLPNPLPSNTNYSLLINAWADDAIFRIAVNGTSNFTGSGGNAYGPYPATASVFLPQLVAGLNTIEIDAADLYLFAHGMGAQILLTQYETPPVYSNPIDYKFIFPPNKYDNPCVKQRINIAYQNAANKYQQYINPIITTFADNYSKHCLSALETFTYKYVDKEYHHTLYYYDQAGNLIKTIPPEGVEYVQVASSTDALEKQIISDRTNSQQTVFTNHRMETRYVYNSLNQLVFQSLPDHDNMDICGGTNPNGLDTGLVINAIQFVNNNRGYLCGHLKKTGVFNRGYVYSTNDGGNSWTRVSGVTSGDLQKVQFVSSSNGYAVSTFGMVFKSTDGGNKWDLLTGLYTMSPRYVDVLTDLYFNGSNAIVGGIMQSGIASGIFYSTDGGATFSSASVSGMIVGDTITSITYDAPNSTYIASSKNGLTGKLFKSTNNGVNWSQLSFAANNLKRVQFISTSSAYAVGEEGTLLKLNGTISSSPVFQLVPTSMLGNFIDVYFKNSTDGVAIIDSVPNKGKIYKTFDGGLTWQPLSPGGQYYNSLQLYDQAGSKLIAAGKNGVLSHVLMGSAPFGVTKIGTTTSQELTFADAYEGGTNGRIAIHVGSATGFVSTCYNSQVASPNWITVSSGLVSWPVQSLDTSFVKVILLDSATVTPYIKGLLLTTSGKVYSFYRPFGATTMTFHLATGVSGFIGDITSNGQSFTSALYAFDTIAKKNYKLTFSGTLISGALCTVPMSRNINAIDMANSGGTGMIMVGNSGHIEYTPSAGIAMTWADASLNTIPVAINKVRFISSNNFIASGIDGAVWKNFGGNTNWYLKKSGTVAKLNSIAVDASGGGYICGNTGKLFQLSNAQTQIPILTSMASGLSAHLTDAALDPSGTSAYITSASGQVLYTSNYNTTPPTQASQSSPFSINGVTFKSTANVVVVGSNVFVAQYNGIGAMVTKDLFTKGLNSIHFFDAFNGVVIDSNNVIRKTADGGNTWSVVLPVQGSPLMTKAMCITVNEGVVIGLNKFIAKFSGNVLSSLATPGGPVPTHFYDIRANKRGLVYIVGSSTRLYSLDPTLYSTSYIGQAVPTSPPDFKAVHVFNNGSCIMVGTKGTVYYYKGTFVQQTNYSPPAGLPTVSVTLRDVFFHDDYTGYMVGSAGAAYRVTLSDSITNLGTVPNAISWLPFCSTALYMNWTTNTQIRKLDFKAIAFSSRTNMMVGGADSNITIGGFNPVRYARLLKEQPGFYSTRFWYDKLGRLVLSQNTRQYNKSNPLNNLVKQAFSYTLYDPLGRIIEVGEKFENHMAGSPQQASIFGSYVNALYNNNSIDDTKFQTWLTDTGPRREVTKTYYDTQSILSGYTQNNLRKRVSSTTYEDAFDGNDLTYAHATHYSYDIHGNVNSLWQENKLMGVSGQGIKQIDYKYDLISGKVNNVIYSPGQVDQFIHRYSYDADNRITMVETSSNGIRYDLDTKYFYYAHGPLARVEYGKNQVQGVDYAYTLQGWIKGVNSNTLKKAKDMGSDGDLSFSNPNGNFARDIFGYSLNYYVGDYESINYMKWNTASTRFEAKTAGSDLATASNDLYNGNISAMATSISKIDTNSSGVVTGSRAFPLGNSYRYDQLNRLKRSYSFTNIDTAANRWLANGASLGLYRNTFSYDANGNIKTQIKRDSVGSLVDSLVYNYETISGKMRRNRLYHVNDYVTSTPTNFGDIKDQGTFTPGTNINQANNYSFDEIGNLIKDNSEKIDTIRWTVYGKIKAIIRNSSSTKDNLYFDYDAAGNRIAKHDYTSGNVWKSSTYYLRDAQGNALSVYTKKTVSSTMSYKLTEQHLYGRSRIGMTQPGLEMIGASAPPDTVKFYLGYKEYELSNHLGNVLSVISDKKIPVASTSTPTAISYYLPDLNSSTDYYTFGSVMYGRNFKSANYRYGFNGKEKDEEIKGIGNSYDFGARIYDPRLGKFLSVDPDIRQYPALTPYCYAANSPIRLVDIDGRGPGDPVGPGYYEAFSTTREVGFFLRHPYYATKIGMVNHNSLNISTNSARFAVNANLRENDVHEGSQTNAYRHALWQATITKEYGADIAKQVGNAHEDNPTVNTGIRTFSGKDALSKADQTVDLLNNEIGRKLGGDNKDLTTKELALKTLDYFKENGLFTAEKQKDGSYNVQQTKLTDKQYNAAKEVLQKTDNQGFTPKQREARDTEAKADAARTN